MRTNNATRRAIIFAFLLCTHTSSYSQNADQPSTTISCSQECLETEHRYIFCRPKPSAGAQEVEWYVKCSTNPNNEYDAVTGARMKVYRPSITNGLICTSFTFKAPDVPVVFSVNTIQGLRIVYDFYTPTFYQPCIDEAIREWTSACSTDAGPLNYVSSTWPQGCCLRVVISNDERDFAGGLMDAPAVAKRNGSSTTSCDGISCRTPQNNQVPANESVRILFNATTRYRDGTVDGYPRRFFTNNLSVLAGSGGESAMQYLRSKRFEYLDFCSVLKHEIGHIFGFTDDGPSAPPVSDGEECKDGNSIMAWEVDVKEDSWKTKGVSSSDRCRFQKLYCCAQTVTSVIEPDENYSTICSGVPEDVDIAFYSINGELLYTTRAKCTVDPQDALKDVKLETGVYLVVVVATNGRIARFKIVVSD